MTRLFRGLALAAAVLGGGLLAAAPARASEPGVMRVQDDAGLFSKDGVAKAKNLFEGTTFKSKTHFAVATVDAIPEGKRAEFDAAKANAESRGRFFETWARELVRSRDRQGDVFALLYRTDRNYFAEVVSDRESDVYRYFNDAKAREVTGVFSRALKAVHDGKLAGDAAKAKMDAALLEATNLVIDDLKATAAPEAGRRESRASAEAGGHAGGSGIMGWLCVGLVVLLGVWLVIGLIRAFTGMGRGGYGPGGYGPGAYGPGGYGGGGGGFFSSLLGGMFGAAAGMYLYDNFFGGHHGGGMSEAAAAGTDFGPNTGDGDFEGGAAAGEGGGDWGDAGPADAGGGDWGGDAGGGDFGGGGDWGGGGGDFGGGDAGGGGDW